MLAYTLMLRSLSGSPAAQGARKNRVLQILGQVFTFAAFIIFICNVFWLGKAQRMQTYAWLTA